MTAGLGWTGHRNSRRLAGDELADRLTHLPERLAEAITPMGRHQDQSFGHVELDPDRFVPPGRRQQCVDHRVARDVDGSGADSFALEVFPGRPGRREVNRTRDEKPPRGWPLRERERRADWSTRFDMSERDAAAKAGYRRRHDRRGVSLRHHEVGTLGNQNSSDRLDEISGQPIIRQSKPHGLEIDVRLIPSAFSTSREFAVLAREQDPAIRPRRRLKRLDQRRHLDGFGPSANRADDRLFMPRSIWHHRSLESPLRLGFAGQAGRDIRRQADRAVRASRTAGQARFLDSLSNGLPSGFVP